LFKGVWGVWLVMAEHKHLTLAARNATVQVQNAVQRRHFIDLVISEQDPNVQGYSFILPDLYYLAVCGVVPSSAGSNHTLYPSAQTCPI
jgi:hypothetical protein